MIFRAYLALFLLQFLAVPFLAYLSKRLPIIKDGFWAFGRFLTWLFLSLIIFLTAFLKIPSNTLWGVYFLLSTLFLINTYFLYFHKKK